MKTIRFYMVALMCMMVATTTFAFDRQVPQQKLPAAAKAFIQKNFSGKNIVYVEEDVEFMKTTYAVRLNDGTKVEFDSKGVWDKVDCKIKSVPKAAVPSSIAGYVKVNFPESAIVKIEKNRYGYEVSLSNKVDLRFNRKGQFSGFDD
ncbi:MAG: PepSY-like domain-containing protein [Prevotella sp.]|nr:PepSY-like domain-containing protein [Prevotella sp.]